MACGVVWAETAVAFPKAQDHAAAMERLGMESSPLNEESAALAGQLCLAYRTGGGKRERLVGDFMIGAHSIVQAEQLLTVDQGFFQKHFRGLTAVGGVGACGPTRGFHHWPAFQYTAGLGSNVR